MPSLKLQFYLKKQVLTVWNFTAHTVICCVNSSPAKLTNDKTTTVESFLTERIIDNIILGIKQSCGSDFSLALRLSPTRFGIEMDEIISYYQRLCASEKLDFIDMSLWDVFQEMKTGLIKANV